eukprot:SAG25_NODE_11855_length_293_cov_1.067010_1_plen_66_part_10
MQKIVAPAPPWAMPRACLPAHVPAACLRALLFAKSGRTLLFLLRGPLGAREWGCRTLTLTARRLRC